MIALALACNPRVLLADEPTTALDVTVQRDILDLLQRLRDERGLGVLFVTHDLDVVRDIADHVVVMRHGEVVESGSCHGVMNARKHPYTQSALAAMRKTTTPCATNPCRGPDGDAPLVAARGVVKRFVTRTNIWGKPTHTFDALKGVDLAIARGERVGLVGESGSGKSTLGNILLGLDTWDEGDVTWKGGAPRGSRVSTPRNRCFRIPSPPSTRA